MLIWELVAADRPWLRELVESVGGLPVVSVSGVHDPAQLPGLVAEDEATRIGAATYRLTDDGCEVVALSAVIRRQGVGTALLRAVRDIAGAHSVRLWLVTTDDNVVAQRFYDSQGMHVVAVHDNFVEQVRAAKPDGQFNFRDAIEYAY